MQPRRATCSQCLRPQRTCLCYAVKACATVNQVLILQHPEEASHAKNTARLAHLCLPNSRLLLGEQFDADKLAKALIEPWQGAPAHPRLLYPSRNAKTVQAAAPPGQAIRLVVIDATWRKSRKMLYLNPCLAALPRYALAGDVSSQYAIRKAHHANQLSTLEAIAHALSEIESEPTLLTPLWTAFDALLIQNRNFLPDRTLPPTIARLTF